MHLIFGIHLDGTEWSPEQASLGEMQVGPAGLLDVLETQLGLTGLTDHPAERINQFMVRMKDSDRSDAWFHESFKADAWSTSKQMLAWRDVLIEAGWKGQADEASSPRIRILAELEQCGLPLSRGRGDRLHDVLGDLARSISSQITRIELIEPLDLLPPVWQRVMLRLREIGVRIEAAKEIGASGGKGNLAAMQAWMSGGEARDSIQDGDDSLLLLRAADEWEAAEHLACWLASDTANEDVTIICEADTDVLDQALRRHGLPQLGRSENSRWRSYLQILPLVLANAWKPMDVQRLVELLTLTPSPVPRYVSYQLMGALKEEPGVGGKAWKKALEKIAEEHQKKALESGKPVSAEETANVVDRLDTLLATERFDPVDGIPAQALHRRCQWIIEELAWRIPEYPTLVEAVSHAREMQKLSEGKNKLPRVTVERMLDSVIGPGSSAPDRVQDAAPWHVLDHPGQIVQPASTIIWWGFSERPQDSSTYWSSQERESLSVSGAQIENPGNALRREAHAWRRAVMGAGERLLMIHPRQLHGEKMNNHPFWDEILSAALKLDAMRTEKQVLASLVRDCNGLVENGLWQLAGCSIALKEAPVHETVQATGSYEIPKNAVPAPEHLSFSSMSTMIGCPMKWTLHYHAKLRMMDAKTLPRGNTMIGTLCHRIVQELYSESGQVWSPEEAEKRAIVLFDQLVPSMASELLLFGNEVERLRYREDIAYAVKQLVEAITQLGLTVEAAEQKIEAEWNDLRFKGFIDLILKDTDGNPFVLDLKWSSSSRYKQAEVEEGAALQLASYAWLLKSADGGGEADGGYFMLKQGTLLSSSPLMGEDALDSPLSLEEIWERGGRTWQSNFNSVNARQLVATQVSEKRMQETEGLKEDVLRAQLKEDRSTHRLLYTQPPCMFCDFGTLCGLTGGDA